MVVMSGGRTIGPPELSFRISRFRPVRGGNIDVFLKMLEPTRVLEVAE